MNNRQVKAKLAPAKVKAKFAAIKDITLARNIGQDYSRYYFITVDNTAQLMTYPIMTTLMKGLYSVILYKNVYILMRQDEWDLRPTPINTDIENGEYTVTGYRTLQGARAAAKAHEAWLFSDAAHPF